jgi:WD40 repeat protein
MTNRQAQIHFRDPTTGRTSGDAIAITNAFCLEFSPDGQTLAGLAGDGSIQLWDVATRQPRARLALPQRMEVTWVGLRWNPDGRYLATHSGFNSRHVWDVARRQLVNPTLDTVWMAISPDWQYAFGLPGGLAGFRNPRQPQPRHPITEDPMVGSAEFSPNGQLLAVALGDNTVQMWNTASGQRVGGPMKTTGRITWMGFTPDGRVLVTAESGERDPGAAPLVSANVRIWDTATALPCGRPIPATAFFIFTGAQFGSDSRTLLLPTLRVVPGTRDQFIPALQAWPLPVSEVPLVEVQERTTSRTGMRLDSAGNVVAAGPGTAGLQ